MASIKLVQRCASLRTFGIVDHIFSLLKLYHEHAQNVRLIAIILYQHEHFLSFFEIFLEIHAIYFGHITFNIVIEILQSEKWNKFLFPCIAVSNSQFSKIRVAWFFFHYSQDCSQLFPTTQYLADTRRTNIILQITGKDTFHVYCSSVLFNIQRAMIPSFLTFYYLCMLQTKIAHFWRLNTCNRFDESNCRYLHHL